MYVKITNGAVDQYPYTVGKLRRDNPNTSFPKHVSDEILAAWGVHTVHQDDVPSYTERTQKIVRDSQPALRSNLWVLGYSVAAKTAEEIQQFDDISASDGRRNRDALIAETDWWASSDLTMTAEQTAYRQALRDITSHANWPHLDEADWPTKP